MPDLKLLKFPGPLDQGGRGNVVGLVKAVRRGSVRRVLCITEDVAGNINWFRNNLSPQQAAALCEQLKKEQMAELWK